MKSKFCKDSLATMTEIVLPNDTNTLGNLMGGRLMHLMDIVAAISAQRHSNRIVVTAGVDSIDFKSSVRLGEIVNLRAFVTRTFTSSMEVFIEVFAENTQNNEKRLCNRAFFTFVAVDQNGNPIPINAVTPESEEEKDMHEGALRRRELRLLLAGRIKPEDAKSLHDILIVKS